MADTLDKISAIPTAQKVALLAVVMIGIAAAWYFLMYEEAVARMGNENGRTPALNKQLAEEREVANNLDKYRAEIEELKRQRDEMRSRLPDSAELADLLQQIHSQAKIVGLEISRFERGEATREALYARIPVKMVLTGSFQQIASFFFNLGQLKRIVNVGDIELTTMRRGTNVEEDRLIANCVATTFQYIASAPEAPAAPGSAAPASAAKPGGH